MVSKHKTEMTFTPPVHMCPDRPIHNMNVHIQLISLAPSGMAVLRRRLQIVVIIIIIILLYYYYVIILLLCSYYYY